MWSFLPADQLVEPGRNPSGSRVALLGTVSFVRSGFARVRWDNGRMTDEWVPDIMGVADAPPRTQHDRGGHDGD